MQVDQYKGPRTHEDLKIYVADKLSSVAGDLHGHEEERVPDTGHDSVSVVS